MIFCIIAVDHSKYLNLNTFVLQCIFVLNYDKVPTYIHNVLSLLILNLLINLGKEIIIRSLKEFYIFVIDKNNAK